MSNDDLQEKLEQGPERIQKALIQFRRATLSRECVESQAYARLKIEHPEASATELKFMLLGDQERKRAVLTEISFEAEYKAAEETHMSNKKLASLRTAF